MGRFALRSQITTEALIRLDEVELRALDALAGYGADAFIKVFYEKLGKAYMEQHEAGLRSFLEAIQEEVPRILGQVDRARMAVLTKPRANATSEQAAAAATG